MSLWTNYDPISRGITGEIMEIKTQKGIKYITIKPEDFCGCEFNLKVDVKDMWNPNCPYGNYRCPICEKGEDHYSEEIEPLELGGLPTHPTNRDIEPVLKLIEDKINEITNKLKRIGK